MILRKLDRAISQSQEHFSRQRREHDMSVRRGKPAAKGSRVASKARGYSGPVRKISRYGWIPDHPDHRDFTYAVPATWSGPVRRRASTCGPSVRPFTTRGGLAVARPTRSRGAIEFDLLKEGLDDYTPSRLFIYYNERVMEGTVGSDAGAMIRDGSRVWRSRETVPSGSGRMTTRRPIRSRTSFRRGPRQRRSRRLRVTIRRSSTRR